MNIKQIQLVPPDFDTLVKLELECIPWYHWICISFIINFKFWLPERQTKRPNPSWKVQMRQCVHYIPLQSVIITLMWGCAMLQFQKLVYYLLENCWSFWLFLVMFVVIVLQSDKKNVMQSTFLFDSCGFSCVFHNLINSYCGEDCFVKCLRMFEYYYCYSTILNLKSTELIDFSQIHRQFTSDHVIHTHMMVVQTSIAKTTLPPRQNCIDYFNWDRLFT